MIARTIKKGKSGERVYEGESVVVSSSLCGCQVTIRKHGSSRGFKLEGPQAIGELRAAIDGICSDKVIKGAAIQAAPLLISNRSP